MQYICKYQSPLGEILLISNDTALTGLWMDTQVEKSKEKNFNNFIEQETPVLSRTKEWLDRYFAGKAPCPRELPLQPNGSAFALRVYELLLEIPYGKTATYGEIAKQIAKEKGIAKMSAQAVGNAVGANPISIIIPCHRVIGVNGQLVGYTGGMDKKIFLLQLEGHPVKTADLTITKKF